MLATASGLARGQRFGRGKQFAIEFGLGWSGSGWKSNMSMP